MIDPQNFTAAKRWAIGIALAAVATAVLIVITSIV